MQSIDEAILIGEAATTSNHISPILLSTSETTIEAESLHRVDELNKMVIKRLEAALELNPTNFDTLHLVFCSCCYGHRFLIDNKVYHTSLQYYTTKSLEYSLKVLNHPTALVDNETEQADCCRELTDIFYENCNYPAALKYAKLAYEHCLRSSDHTNLSGYKAIYIALRSDVAKLPPLRFAVGDEVEFLHELETGSEWKLGKVVELYYRERDFDINFSAPYRIQLLDDSDSTAEPPTNAWVKADIDRYVRKVGVRSIEDTRYQARLDTKVAELARVYCFKEFIQDIYRTLAQDREFVEMLQSLWQIELSESMLSLYRMLVMYRQPLIRTYSGYHVPSSEEVIAGIKAYFDPAHLGNDAAPSGVGADKYLQRARAEFLCVICGTVDDTSVSFDALGVPGLLLKSTRCYFELRRPSGSTNQGRDFTIPLELSEALSRVSTIDDLRLLICSEGNKGYKLFLNAWYGIHTCLVNPDAGPACECPFIYFFVKYCLDQGWGVPKLALAMYDRMNMQLSREFIRCANPTCELNRLDKSTGQVKFKLCSRCKTVIYCSRECQVTHYPEHKRLCKEHSTG